MVVFLLETRSCIFWLHVYCNLRHLDVVSAQKGLSPCGLDPINRFLINV